MGTHPIFESDFDCLTASFFLSRASHCYKCLNNKRKTMVETGETVFVKGTGRRYHGSSYSATVVDVRDNDDTIKIRYTDGGFKRFSRAEFERLRLKPGDRGSITGTIEAYELRDDQYDGGLSIASQHAEINQLDSQIIALVNKRDFTAAAASQTELDELLAAINVKCDLETGIKEAVARRDFSKAAELQARINAMNEAGSNQGTSGATQQEVEIDWATILEKAKKRALGSGGAGAIAMVFQVCSLMWMRTTMNYQYRYGMTTRVAFSTLYKQGGIRRFYRGLTPALLQGPLSRFSDTAANTGILTLMAQHPKMVDLPIAAKTVVASATAASMRILLMPIDTVKTTMQVEGKDGVKMLRQKIAKSPTALWHGSAGAVGATFAGHYPWFATYNILQEKIPPADTTLSKLGRNAVIGFTSSVVSDTVSNSIRVLKTYRQTSGENISYAQCARNVIEQDGVMGLMGRGLKTRILANGMQGLMFSVLWKFFDEKFSK